MFLCVSSRSSLIGISCMHSSFKTRPKCLTFSSCVLMSCFTAYCRHNVCNGIKRIFCICNDEKVLLDYESLRESSVILISLLSLLSRRFLERLYLATECSLVIGGFLASVSVSYETSACSFGFRS